MSRGRGRGWGRGRGNYGLLGSPEAKEIAGPPPLFPDLEAPEAPVRIPKRVDPSPADEELRAQWRSCQTQWKQSPFYLQIPAPLTGQKGFKRSLDDFLQEGPQSKVIDTKALLRVITLSPKYVPDELVSNLDRRISKQAATHEYFTRQGPDDAGNDILAKLGAIQEAPEDAKKEDRKEDAETENEAEELEELAESEMEDDDYMQGFEYDDDEGYEDERFGGDDNEPVY